MQSFNKSFSLHPDALLKLMTQQMHCYFLLLNSLVQFLKSLLHVLNFFDRFVIVCLLKERNSSHGYAFHTRPQFSGESSNNPNSQTEFFGWRVVVSRSYLFRFFVSLMLAFLSFVITLLSFYCPKLYFEGQ